MSSENCYVNGDFVDFHKGKKPQVSTRKEHLFAALLFVAAFLLFSHFISSNGNLLGEISRLNYEIDAFEKLKERLTNDELELVLKCQKMNQLESKIEEGNSKLDWNWQQLNETEIKMHNAESTLDEIGKLEQRLRNVMNELDLGLEKMLRGAERDSFGFSGLGQAI